MDFSQKITPVRLYSRSSNLSNLKYLAEQYESDRGRIIQSAAIRRLQQKTQVFPLENNSAVRSRLTHSLEVQQTGRHIVRTLFKKLANTNDIYNLRTYEREVESLVEMACLMHDIGNPPFGHFGEAAINRWFKTNLDKHPAFIQVNNRILAMQLHHELEHFEGNAQAFRILLNLSKLNLTFSQLASILKYTRCGLEHKPESDNPLSYLKKKVGYYYSEQTEIQAMCSHLDIKSGHRFPFAYLMEAADDISYCLADIEDGVEKGLLNCEQLAEHLLKVFKQLAGSQYDDPFLKGKTFQQAIDFALQRAQKESINKVHEFFVWLRVQLIHPLVDHAATGFIDNIKAIYEGNLNRAILEDGSLHHQVIKTLKEVAISQIFSTKEVENKELQGYQIITGLLNSYQPLLTYSHKEFYAMALGKSRGGLIESRLFKRLGKKQIKAYLMALEPLQSEGDLPLFEFYYRCRLIQDFISGMTDQFALEEYQSLQSL